MIVFFTGGFGNIGGLEAVSFTGGFADKEPSRTSSLYNNGPMILLSVEGITAGSVMYGS